jgi:conjugative transfer region protein TrbK
MRRRLVNMPAIGRAFGFVLIAVAIVAAALHFRTLPQRAEPRAANTPATPDALADELRRCQRVADQAKDDAACEAAWAESRRRFFTYAPAHAATPASPATNTSR